MENGEMNINYEELLNKLLSIRTTINKNNDELFANANRDRHVVDYNSMTERTTYNKEEVVPGKDNTKDTLYRKIIVDYNLQQYFTREVFDKIYDIYYRKNSRGSFTFDSYLVEGLMHYVHYMEYVSSNQSDMSFEQFEADDIYKKMEQEKAKAAWREETKKVQQDFVPRTPSELQAEYAEYKYYIDDSYRKMVCNLGCEDLIPLSRFLELYDKADRNYENIDTPVDDRLLSQVISEYASIFKLEGVMTSQQLWGIVRKAIDEQDVSFRTNMEQLGIQEEMDKGRSL